MAPTSKIKNYFVEVLSPKGASTKIGNSEANDEASSRALKLGFLFLRTVVSITILVLCLNQRIQIVSPLVLSTYALCSHGAIGW